MSDLLISLQRLREIRTALQILPERELQLQFYLKQPAIIKFIDQYNLIKENYFYYIPLFKLLMIGEVSWIPSSTELSKEWLDNIVKNAESIDQQYQLIGGIFGYQEKVLELLINQDEDFENADYLPPSFIDLSIDSSEDKDYLASGIEKLPYHGEIYLLGGAAERLNTKSEKVCGAQLQFLGKTLLEHLIDECFGREYLYYKMSEKQITTPIACMISEHEGNDTMIRKMCENKNWYGRGRENIKLFHQDKAPLFNAKGQWAFNKATGDIMTKPGGHGSLWKSYLDHKINQWFEKRNVKKVLIRQINNPIAGIDNGIVKFFGVNWHLDKALSFYSCSQLSGRAEGVNVMKVCSRGGGREGAISNVEYCEKGASSLMKRGSLYLANTNIILFDLLKMQEVIKRKPWPGILINRKKGVGLARLESTMQKISEELKVDIDREELDVMVTKGKRSKTLSAIKKLFDGKSFIETPEECFYQYLLNAQDLLVNYCHFDLELLSLTPNLKNLPFIFTYHPALGPFYEIIAEKMQYGRLERGSELSLEIADLYFNRVVISGSLLVHTDYIMGHFRGGKVVFSERRAKISLINVRVENSGRKNLKLTDYKLQPNHQEKCLITLGENAKFTASDVVLRGDIEIDVPDNMHYTAVESNLGYRLIKKRRTDKGSAIA